MASLPLFFALSCVSTCQHTTAAAVPEVHSETYLDDACNQSATFLQTGTEINAMRLHSRKTQKDRQAGLPSMVLFTWVFGESYVRAPLFKLFLASAAGCGADVVVLGDAWPSDVMKPANVRHEKVSWDQLISLLEEKIMDGERLDDMRSHATEPNYKKIIDVKPMTAYLVPHLVQGYDWWGYMDNDLLLGDLSSVLLPQLQQSSTDVWSEQVQEPEISSWTRKAGVCYSHGPFTVLRTSSAASSLLTKASYRDIAQQAVRDNTIVNFDENAYSQDNYTRSFSWILLSAAKSSEIVMTKLLSKANDVNDIRCFGEHANAPVGLDCGFCMFQPEPAAGQELVSVMDYPNIGRSVLLDKGRSDIVFCHMQKGKKAVPNFDETVSAHLGDSRLAYSLRFGFNAIDHLAVAS